MELYGKLSRLYTTSDLAPGADIALTDNQAHYLKNVLRKNTNDTVRLFNGRDGEFTAAIKDLGKKGGTVTLQEKIRRQPGPRAPVHLLFAPIKKDRMDFLIEKSVELGVTDLHPVLTHRTENRNLKEERLRAQVLESAEQCERMDIPVLHPPVDLKKKIAAWPAGQTILWCFERSEGSPPLSSIKQKQWAFLTGPEGGFDETEAQILSSQPVIKAVSLGPTVYRAETAALLCLSWANMTTAL
ncbi:MAG: 16S rRNA (uracil(1498)-N(3))-methyltransferase [Alphaproteobacteria bacterium]|nr:16S rRNA (uracil(1498)-N(3))-methyltransferase [Alphaproteobacteria bacterium]